MTDASIAHMVTIFHRGHSGPVGGVKFKPSMTCIASHAERERELAEVSYVKSLEVTPLARFLIYPLPQYTTNARILDERGSEADHATAKKLVRSFSYFYSTHICVPHDRRSYVTDIDAC